MGVTQYIGARYQPRFADPDQWDNQREYEPLTIVLHEGNSYTSKQTVPVGIDIKNGAYWAETGNYNAQVEAYRREVLGFDARITETETEVTNVADDLAKETAARIETDDELTEKINGEIAAREEADTVIGRGLSEVIGRFPLATEEIADAAITGAKLATGAVDNSKLADGAVSSGKIADGAIGLVDLNSNVQQRILNKNIRYTHAVFIGDSYGRGVGGTDMRGWPYYTAQALNLSSYVNISNSGAGFIAKGHSESLSGMTFADQLDYAAAHLPDGIEAWQVDLVVFGGGYNDHAQSGINAAVFSTVRKAYTLFPNAKVCFLPYCTGDRELTSEYNSAYHNMVIGASRAGAATCEASLYWLYPYQLNTSYGDNIHPNDTGYQILGRYSASFIMGGEVLAFTETLGASAEGYAVASGASSNGFRCGVTHGIAWFSGSFIRKGAGALCTLPSYLRPIKTTYFLAFVYADSGHHGVARMRVLSNGELNFYDMEIGTYDASLTYTVYLPFTCTALGHEWE